MAMSQLYFVLKCCCIGWYSIEKSVMVPASRVGKATPSCLVGTHVLTEIQNGKTQRVHGWQKEHIREHKGHITGT